MKGQCVLNVSCSVTGNGITIQGRAKLAQSGFSRAALGFVGSRHLEQMVLPCVWMRNKYDVMIIWESGEGSVLFWMCFVAQKRNAIGAYLREHLNVSYAIRSQLI